MSKLSGLKGIIVPIITPLNKDETVDETSLRKCIRYILKGGVHGIFVNSTTGEAMALSDSEREKAIRLTIDENNNQSTLFVGISETSTQRVLDNLEMVNNLKVDAVALHPYFYYPLNDDTELIRFYSTVAAHSKHPLMIYDIPSTTKIKIPIHVIQELLKIDNIIGIKDSSVDYLNLLSLLELKRIRPDFKIFIGKSHLWTSGILEGADGGLDGLSNLVPDLCVNLYQHIIKKDLEKAFALQHKLNDIWKVYQCKSFLSGIKTAMSYLNLCNNYVTHPNMPASQQEAAKIKNILLKHQLL